MKKILVCLTVAASTGWAAASPIQFTPLSIPWTDKLPNLPAGAKGAVLEGDPTKDGLFTIRISLPPEAKLPAHWHPQDERVVVLSGSINVGFGSVGDHSKAKSFLAGSFYINPARETHYAWTDEGAVLQITGFGPWEFHEGTADAAVVAVPGSSEITLENIRNGKVSAGVHKIEGIVVATGRSPDRIQIAESSLGIRPLAVLTKNPDRFEIGQRYGFSVRVTNRRSAVDGQAFDVELFAR